ncbi:MAG: hypothetical protein RL318_2043 [Fibrobacterota bacterium]|jgi:very-short-patch-repair endonuclease
MRDSAAYLSLPYNPKLKERARELRKARNLSEVLLWNRLKKGQLMGLDFDRQKIIGNYIVDFYCAEKRAVVEVDGKSHDDKVEYDAIRDAFLMSLGLQVIHIPVVEVFRNLSGVVNLLTQRLCPVLESSEAEAETPSNRCGRTTPPRRGTPPGEGK